MKYAIELTDNQKEQMDLLSVVAHKHFGFNPKLEPIENSWESELEKHRKQAFNEGYEHGIADYRKFEKFFNSDGIEMFDDIRNTDGTLSLDMILQYLPMCEIMARIRAYEEKKKAEEIKVGDEVNVNGDLAIVTRINPNDYDIFYHDGITGTPSKKDCEKTGRHFNEVKQILSKLRGEE